MRCILCILCYDGLLVQLCLIASFGPFQRLLPSAIFPLLDALVVTPMFTLFLEEGPCVDED
jgi:hypothetical protein